MTDLSTRAYSLITASYWGFTLTDGALRMLVLLHFYTLGYTPLQIATLFLFYEFFGVVTNLFGGWIASHSGLRATLLGGLGLQVFALVALALLNPGWPIAWAVAWVMAAQALSGIAKDLTKMSAKSAVKLLVTEGERGRLFRWVAVLTGSKNALKGAGFFLGGLLLQWLGFAGALYAMATGLVVALALSAWRVPREMGQARVKKHLGQLLSKSSAINRLSAARFFLFGARDVWFVVGLPIYLDSVLGWGYATVGGFLAAWVIGYGIVQALAPTVLPDRASRTPSSARVSAFALAVSLAAMLGLWHTALPAVWVVSLGLALFGIVFAINSAIHSYLVLAYSQRDNVTLDVGFYYMANAAGRLVGTVLSGYLYQQGGLVACLSASLVFVVASFALALRLPPLPAARPGG